MQVSTKFTIAIHVLAATEFFGNEEKVTSKLLASSIGSNPVIIRNIMSDLQKAGLIETKRGPGGISITRPLDQITFYDVYEAVEKIRTSSSTSTKIRTLLARLAATSTRP